MDATEEELGTYPYGAQSDANAVSQGATPCTLSLFAPQALPVKRALAHSYGVFNRLYRCAPHRPATCTAARAPPVLRGIPCE